VSRRGAKPTEPSRWVFNRLAADYRRRPGYPGALAARLLAIAGGPGARVADLGAGTGQLAIPLARLGARVDAVEPARAMLDVLEEDARGLAVAAVHSAAEETGLPAGVFDLALLADAAQWVDPGRAGREVARLLARSGALAVVEPRLADTPFLRALEALPDASLPRGGPGRDAYGHFRVTGLAVSIAPLAGGNETLADGTGERRADGRVLEFFPRQRELRLFNRGVGQQHLGLFQCALMSRLGRLETRVGGVKFLRRDHFLGDKRFHPLKIDLSLIELGPRLNHPRSLIHIELRRRHRLQPQTSEHQRQIPLRLLRRIAKLRVFNAR